MIGRNKEEHDERLIKVLQRLKDSGITLNPDKCLLSTSRLQYLGQVIDSDRIRKDPAMVKAIPELPEPKDVPRRKTISRHGKPANEVTAEPCRNDQTDSRSA